MKRQLGESERW